MGIVDRSESRGGAQVIWLAVHSTEGNGTAQQLRDAAWWTGSSHAINDEYGALLTPAEGCVPYDRASWTLRGGNRFSENIEQVGWARWTREEWLARPKLLDSTARWLAARSKARGIPLVKLTPADVAAGRPGVIGHVDYTLGTGDGSHTDPGKGYPWDVVMDKARAYAAGTPTEEDPLAALSDGEQRELLDGIRYLKKNGEGDRFIHEIPGRVAAIVGDVDESALAAALAPLVIQALGEAHGIGADDVEAALRRVLADAANG